MQSAMGSETILSCCDKVSITHEAKVCHLHHPSISSSGVDGEGNEPSSKQERERLSETSYFKISGLSTEDDNFGGVGIQAIYKPFLSSSSSSLNLCGWYYLL